MPSIARLGDDTKASFGLSEKRKYKIGFASTKIPSPEGTPIKAVALMTFSESLFTAALSFFAKLSDKEGRIPLPNILVTDGIRLNTVIASPVYEP